MLASGDEQDELCEAKFTKKTQKKICSDWKNLSGPANFQGGV